MIKKSINNKPKVVFIVGYKILNWLYLIIIPILKKKYNTCFVILAPASTYDQYKKVLSKKRDVFIARDNQLESNFIKGFGKSIRKEESIARKKEDTYRINYMRDIIQQDRSLSTGFLSHAKKFIWGINNASSEDLIRLSNGYINFTESLIKKYKFDIGIIWPVDALSAALAGVFESKDIFVTFPYNSKYKSFGFWTSSAFLDNSKLKKYFLKDKETISKDKILLAKPESGYIGLDKLDLNFGPKQTIKRILKKIFFRIEFLFLDIIKLDFKKKERINFLKSLLFEYNGWKIYREFAKISERNLNNFNKPFLFYALSLEPEFSVQGRSKEFNNQETIIKQLALNMPAGFELVIKEHVDIGRRDISFYKDLLKFPNIRMAHPTVRGTDLINKSRAVASLVGTVSLEASLMGKKAIEFSLHSSFSFMPNIITVRDMTLLDKYLIDIMKKNNKETVKIIKNDAAKLLRAIEKTSFNAEKTPLFYGTRTNLESDNINRIVDLLLKSYSDHIEK